MTRCVVMTYNRKGEERRCPNLKEPGKDFCATHLAGGMVRPKKRAALVHRGECRYSGYAPWDAEGHELDAKCPVREDDQANQIGGV